MKNFGWVVQSSRSFQHNPSNKYFAQSKMCVNQHD